MSPKWVSIQIDGHSVSVPEGSTILDASHELGIAIPTLCWLPKHAPWASCLVCSVQVEGNRRLVPACNALAQEGMSVATDSELVRKQRKVALELLLSDHVGDCVAPCENVCPAHLDIPAMNTAVAEGRLHDAAEIVKDTIPLPSTLGRICPTPCEGRCRRRPLDGAVSVCLLKRYVGDTDIASDEPLTPPVGKPTGKRVAIIGTGPAGLSAAYFLLRRGHACVLYDEHEEAGGALRHSVPVDRLPREVLDAEIDMIRRMGAEFRLGKRVTLDEVRIGTDAVVLAIGPVGKGDEVPVERADKGLRVKKGTGETSELGVFAAGAAVSPSKISVRSIGDAHAVSDAVHVFLGGELGALPAFALEAERQTNAFAESRMKLAAEAPRTAPHGDGLSPEEAQIEASRCLQCGCAKQNDCVLRDLAGRYGASADRFSGSKRTPTIDDSHPDIILEQGKCISCGICVRIAAEHAERLGLSFHGRGFDTRIEGPLGQSLAEALKIAGKECADACPTGALYARK